jgi:hypothetical protein
MLNRLAFLIALAGTAFTGTNAVARVFSYQDASVAMFIRATGGPSNVGNTPFDNSSGTDTSINTSSDYQYSGEFGSVISLGSMVNLRLGVELMRHHPAEGAGKNPSDQERFQLESSTFIFHPNISVEVIHKVFGNTRFFFYAGAGYADVTVDNAYTMTAQGTTDFGIGDYTEKLAGSTYSGFGGIGLETLFVDNVTFSADFGYRYMSVGTLKYKGAANTILSPSGVGKGDTALNHDGNKRSLDLGGIYVGVGFRFHLNFL